MYSERELQIIAINVMITMDGCHDVFIWIEIKNATISKYHSYLNNKYHYNLLNEHKSYRWAFFSTVCCHCDFLKNCDNHEVELEFLAAHKVQILF